MKNLFLIGGAIVGGLLLLSGGIVLINVSSSGHKNLLAYLPLFRQYAQEYGIPVTWLLGISGWETRGSFHPRLVAGKGTADERRGGSFGLMQMSLQTARGLGYDGPDLSLDNVKGTYWQPDIPAGSLLDPAVNVRFGAAYLAQLRKQHGNNFFDVAAAYNSGRPYDKAPSVTRSDYVPGADGYRKKFEAEGIA